MKTERIIGGIPESKILKLYVGDMIDQFEQVWVRAFSPSEGKQIDQVRLERHCGKIRLHIAYSKTGNCIMMIMKAPQDSKCPCCINNFYTIKRTLTPLSDPGGMTKMQKMIKEFIAEIGQDN